MAFSCDLNRQRIAYVRWEQHEDGFVTRVYVNDIPVPFWVNERGKVTVRLGPEDFRPKR